MRRFNKIYKIVLLAAVMCVNGNSAMAQNLNNANAQSQVIITDKEVLVVDTNMVVRENAELVNPVVETTVTEIVTDTLMVLQRVPSLKLNDWMTLDYDTIYLKPNYAFIPLIFKKQKLQSDTIENCSTAGAYKFDVDYSWIDNAVKAQNNMQNIRYYAISHSPGVVLYNSQKLPEPPKEFVSVVDPKSRTLKIVERDLKKDAGVSTKREKVKVRNWLHTFSGSLHFSQAYVSKNWYQGGNNNLNVVSDMQWNVELNTNKHKNYMFSNTVRYRVGVISTPDDKERKYSLSDDYFQLNTQFGVKAIKKWYYSASMQFKTQLLNNYQANSTNKKASLLSPAELNIGVGVSFNNASKNGARSISLTLAPVSYNMKYCMSKENPAPTNFGISSGQMKHDVGSKIEARFSWKFNHAINWSTRLYTFTNYKFVQGDWENTFNFNVTSYLTTRLNVHLRYDKSVNKHEVWDYWQLKEILSFGLSYRFATN